MARIDAHQHFWQLGRGDYAWLGGTEPALAPLRRDFAAGDLAPLLREHDIERTVLVQATDTVAETEFMLSLAREHRFVAGVVGWVDLASDDASATLERLAEDRTLRSIRPMVQDLPEDDWILRAPRADALRTLQRLGLRFDALVKPRQLRALARFAMDRPALPVVIDHAAKPPLSEDWQSPAMQSWRRDMAALAAMPQVCCKLSGLLTELAPAHAASRERALARLRPVVEALLAWFGPARLMWGSDWPVLTLGGSYADWIALSDALLAPLSDAERAHVLGGCATRFYGLEAA